MGLSSNMYDMYARTFDLELFFIDLLLNLAACSESFRVRVSSPLGRKLDSFICCRGRLRFWRKRNLKYLATNYNATAGLGAWAEILRRQILRSFVLDWRETRRITQTYSHADSDLHERMRTQTHTYTRPRARTRIQTQARTPKHTDLGKRKRFER